MSGILIPKCIALCRQLSPGARLLWGMIRSLSKRDGYCDAAEDTLARRLAVSSRQIRRYCHQLEAAGFLETEQRRGTTARRWLLLHPSFGGPVGLAPDTSVRTPGHKRPDPWTHPSTTVNNSENIPVAESFVSVQVGGLSLPRSNGLKPLGQILQNTFPEAEAQAIKTHVSALGFPCTDELLQQLYRKALVYGVNGFVIGAHIERAGRKVGRRPSQAPQSAAWVTAVVENALAQGKTST